MKITRIPKLMLTAGEGRAGGGREREGEEQGSCASTLDMPAVGTRCGNV